jgi:hypothetical protein
MPHASWLSHITFNPDGTRLATACRDGTARLWNSKDGTPLTPPLTQPDTAQTIHFTTDGLVFLVRTHAGFRFYESATGDPVTIDYEEKMASGIGMDSENYHAIMNADGTCVFLGLAMNDSARWQIAQPRDPAPEWFPDLLESLAMMALDPTGTPSRGPQHVSRDLPARILAGAPAQTHHAWARNALGID